MSWTHNLPDSNTHPRGCAAIILADIFEDKLPWIPVPCDKLMDNVIFICEALPADLNASIQASGFVLNSLKLDFQGKPQDNYNINILFCPIYWLYFHNDHVNMTYCVRILKWFEISSTICQSIGGQPLLTNDTRMSYKPPGYVETLFKSHGEAFSERYSHSEECFRLSHGNTNSFSCSGFVFHKENHPICVKEPTRINDHLPSGLFKCVEGTLVLQQNVCDGDLDCPNGDDEWNCSVCTPADTMSPHFNINYCYHECPTKVCVCNRGYFHCQRGGCVSLAKVCDCKYDCSDKSDELCSYNYCKDKACPFQSDFEERLANFQKNHYLSFGKTSVLRSVSDVCESPEFLKCAEGSYLCYPQHRMCVYERSNSSHLLHCPSGAHLQSCIGFQCPHMFQCIPGESYCIPHTHVCDGVADCPDGRDEFNCSQPRYCPGLLKCKGENTCVHPIDIGDGIKNCLLSGDDERLCTNFTCPKVCRCIGFVHFCDKQLLDHLPKFHPRTQFIDISYNRLDSKDIELESTTRLLHLDVSFNVVLNIYREQFKSASYLHQLNLSHNNITNIASRSFINLLSLNTLDLSFNHITKLNDTTFIGLNKLETLILNHCKIHLLVSQTFSALRNLRDLHLGHNYIKFIFEETFVPLLNLESLDITGNKIKFAKYIPQAFPKGLNYLAVDASSRICCYFVDSATKCVKKDDKSCRALIEHPLYYYLLWINACLCMVFNISEMFFHASKGKMSGFIYLAVNLSLANILTSVYLTVVGMANWYFGDTYFAFSEWWTESLVCKFAQVASFLSLQMSVFFNFAVTLEKMLGTKYPFKRKLIPQAVYPLICIGGWVFHIVVICVCLYGIFIENSDNDICIGIPITGSLKAGHAYAIVLLCIYSDGIISIVTCVVHLLIYKTVHYSETLQSRNNPLISRISLTRKILPRIFLHLFNNGALLLLFMCFAFMLHLGRSMDKMLQQLFAICLLPGHVVIMPLCNISTAVIHKKLKLCYNCCVWFVKYEKAL